MQLQGLLTKGVAMKTIFLKVFSIFTLVLLIAISNSFAADLIRPGEWQKAWDDEVKANYKKDFPNISKPKGSYAFGHTKIDKALKAVDSKYIIADRSLSNRESLKNRNKKISRFESSMNTFIERKQRYYSILKNEVAAEKDKDNPNKKYINALKGLKKGLKAIEKNIKYKYKSLQVKNENLIDMSTDSHEDVMTKSENLIVKDMKKSMKSSVSTLSYAMNRIKRDPTIDNFYEYLGAEARTVRGNLGTCVAYDDIFNTPPRALKTYFDGLEMIISRKQLDPGSMAEGEYVLKALKDLKKQQKALKGYAKTMLK
jgi:hypothetical protein